jgi:hypothetical protein
MSVENTEYQPAVDVLSNATLSNTETATSNAQDKEPPSHQTSTGHADNDVPTSWAAHSQDTSNDSAAAWLSSLEEKQLPALFTFNDDPFLASILAVSSATSSSSRGQADRFSTAAASSSKCV